MVYNALWLIPALSALCLYGIGQGLVKKYIDDVPPARFCLYFIVAKAVVNLGFFAIYYEGNPFVAGGFPWAGTAAYILDGIGWILYFKSIVYGPISIVGTLSAAYPAMTVLFARVFLNEMLTPIQYAGVALVIGGCIGLSYSPQSEGGRSKGRTWMIYAGLALVLWGAAQTLVKYSYSLPQASEVNLALFNTLGGFLTLGVYGLLFGRKAAGDKTSLVTDWGRSFLPMAMMAAGDLGVIIASRFGPVSLVTPLTGAYPLVTIVFAYFALNESISRARAVSIVLILVGMFIDPLSSLM
jgi:drug/metabolite transporter (DMT)-like permease